MKFNGNALVSLCLALITLAVFIKALDWPLRTALFPIVISVPVFFMSVIDMLLNLFERNGDKVTGEGFGVSATIDQATADKRALISAGWILGFFSLVVLFGFNLSVPIFFIIYFRLYGKENWKISVALTATAWAAFYILLVRICNIFFFKGLIQKGLSAIGATL